MSDLKKLDDDQDRQNPAYVPRKGAFFEHDLRLADDGSERDKMLSKKDTKTLVYLYLMYLKQLTVEPKAFIYVFIVQNMNRLCVTGNNSCNARSNAVQYTCEIP